MDTNYIYLIYTNTNMDDGSGVMTPHTDSGYFTNLEEAWEAANKIPGVQGYMPVDGWQNHPWNNQVWVHSVPSQEQIQFIERIHRLVDKVVLKLESMKEKK